MTQMYFFTKNQTCSYSLNSTEENACCKKRNLYYVHKFNETRGLSAHYAPTNEQGSYFH